MDPVWLPVSDATHCGSFKCRSRIGHFSERMCGIGSGTCVNICELRLVTALRDTWSLSKVPREMNRTDALTFYWCLVDGDEHFTIMNLRTSSQRRRLAATHRGLCVALFQDMHPKRTFCMREPLGECPHTHRSVTHAVGRQPWAAMTRGGHRAL